MDVQEDWCAIISSALSQMKINDRPLEGVNVHVRHSRREPYSLYGKKLKESLERFGATITPIDDLAMVLELEHDYSPLDDIDAFLMLACTISVSAETIELTHLGRGGRRLRDRLHVLMPDCFGKGFIRKRLVRHGVHVDLYEQGDLDEGMVCFRTLSRLIEQKRKEDGLEKARLTEFTPRIGIVTALSVEFEAMSSLLENQRPDVRRPKPGILHEVLHGTIEAERGGHHQVVLALSGVGNNAAAIEADRLFQMFNLDEVFVVGIAGGLPGITERQDDIRLGDVVVSGRKGVIQYDMIKQTPEAAQPNHNPRPPSEIWLRRTEALLLSPNEIAAYRDHLALVSVGKFKRPSGKKDVLWDDSDADAPKKLTRICHPDRKSGEPMVFHGIIGSANTVVKSQAHREKIRQGCGAIAVEMESSGVADAATRNGKPFFVVRGVCDYANTGKNNDWHPYAAMAAASFAYSLIRSMPLVEEGTEA